jgi:hypothetical protein
MNNSIQSPKQKVFCKMFKQKANKILFLFIISLLMFSNIASAGNIIYHYNDRKDETVQLS